MTYITCNHLSLGYDNQIIVSDLNFQVKKGDYLCVVGENGAGKSTLIKTLLHLQKKISGEIVIGNNLSPYEIGYLPQQTPVQKDFPATPFEIVLSGTLPKCGIKPFYKKAEKQLAKENMQRLGIWHLRHSCYRYLSGGQQQRVLLARALCAANKILLLDEPTTGLDPKTTLELYQIIKQLNNSGVSIIMISHDIQAIYFATHILHIQQQHTFFGTKEEYLHSNYWKSLKNQEDIRNE